MTAPATEVVNLENGRAVQALIPGVAPVSVHAREIAAQRARQDARRQHQGMPAGGLFDDVARSQPSLF